MHKILSVFGLLCVIGGLMTAVVAAANDVVPASGELPDSNCLSCHTNAEVLQALAEEEILPAPPSEGSG